MIDSDLAMLMLLNRFPWDHPCLPWLLDEPDQQVIEIQGEPQVGAQVCWISDDALGFFDPDEVIFKECVERKINCGIWIYHGTDGFSNGWEQRQSNVHGSSIEGREQVYLLMHDHWAPFDQWLDNDYKDEDD